MPRPPALALPDVIGHRGAASYAPENTLESLREARHRGARWVEFDAKLTADGAVVLIHDETVDRTTDGHGAVAAMTAADLARLDAGAWFGPAHAGARIPTLSQALALLVELDLHANVEIKPCPGREAATARAVVEVIGRDWPVDRPWPLLSSFSRQSLAAARDAAPEIPRGFLIWRFQADWAAAAAALDCTSMHCAEQHLTRPWAAEIRRLGYGLAVYTVNDAARARALRDWGAHCIISDVPDRILAGF